MDACDEFLAESRYLIARYNEIEVRTLLIQSTKHPWTPIGLRAEATNSPTATDELPCTANVRAIRERIPIAELGGLVERLREGRLAVAGEDVKFIQESSPPQPPRLNFSREDRRYARIMRESEWPALSLNSHTIVQQEFGNVGDKLSDELRMLDAPWDGLSDVQEAFLGNRHDSWRGQYGQIIVRVPFPVRFSTGTIVSEKTIRPELEFLPNNDITGVTVSCIVRRDGAPTMRVREKVADVPREGGRSSVSFPCPFGAKKIILTLMVDGREADVWTWETFSAFAGPARFAALDHSYGKEKLTEVLTIPRGRNFEQGVSLAFHMAGFSTGNYGFVGNQADIVAFPDVGRFALVIECTSGGTDLPSKLQKLAIRTQTLAQRIDGKVNGVLVCQAKHDLEAASVRERAKHDHLALMAPENLLKMIDQAARGASTTDIRNYLRTLVPDGGSLGHLMNWDQ